VAKGEQRVQLVGAIVLQTTRRAAGRGICSATGGVASKYDRQQSAFEKLNT
jgi:hypothetical protein